MADRPLCVQTLGSGGPAALDLSGCFLLAGPEEREGDRNGLRWREACGSGRAEETSTVRLRGERPEQAWHIVGAQEITWPAAG